MRELLIDNIEIMEEDNITLSPERVKDFLELIYNKSPFSLEFSENKPKNTLGVYSCKENKITLYYKHFKSNYDLMKTAIHELAHHIDFIKYGRRQKPHTGSFKEILSYAEKLAIEKGILEEKKDSKLDNVLIKGAEFGKSILDFVENDTDHHKMDELQKILFGASKKSIVHYCRVYNTVKNKELN